MTWTYFAPRHDNLRTLKGAGQGLAFASIRAFEVSPPLIDHPSDEERDSDIQRYVSMQDIELPIMKCTSIMRYHRFRNALSSSIDMQRRFCSEHDTWVASYNWWHDLVLKMKSDLVATRHTFCSFFSFSFFFPCPWTRVVKKRTLREDRIDLSIYLSIYYNLCIYIYIYVCTRKKKNVKRNPIIQSIVLRTAVTVWYRLWNTFPQNNINKINYSFFSFYFFFSFFSSLWRIDR